MALPVSIMVPAVTLPSSEVKRLRDGLDAKLRQLLINAGYAHTPDEVMVRDGLPTVDFGLSTNRTWTTGALTAGTRYTYVNVALANNKFVGVYGISYYSSLYAISEVTLAYGASGATTLGSYEIEQLYTEQIPKGYFVEPVIYGPNDTMFFTVFPRLSSSGETLVIMSLVAEPVGQVVAGARWG
jgi:hypothetical protein